MFKGEYISRTCNLCGVMMHGGIESFKKHGEEYHPDYFLQCSAENYKNIKFIKKMYWCPIDQNWHGSRVWLARRLKKLGWTNERYYKKYGQQYMPNEWKENTSDPVLGDGRNHSQCLQCGKPSGFDSDRWQYNAFCCFSCSTTWYAKNTDRPNRAMKTLKERQKENPNLRLAQNQVQYWINKGFSEIDAKEKVKERQTTNSLEAFIKRAGGDVELGTKNHADRQEKWLKSMLDSGMYSGFSKISENLFSKLETMLDIKLLYGKEERSVRFADQVYKIDCLFEKTNKIIEFFGDYWHGNPNIYSSDDVIRAKKKYTVGEKWKTDRMRIESLEKKGYSVLVIWEQDFKKNTEETINKCIEFLSD